MTRTARRRWTRELANEVDGLAVGESGPVLVHGYEPPAGGKWVDDVIPGRRAQALEQIDFAPQRRHGRVERGERLG